MKPALRQGLGCALLLVGLAVGLVSALVLTGQRAGQGAGPAAGAAVGVAVGFLAFVAGILLGLERRVRTAEIVVANAAIVIGNVVVFHYFPENNTMRLAGEAVFAACFLLSTILLASMAYRRRVGLRPTQRT